MRSKQITILYLPLAILFVVSIVLQVRVTERNIGYLFGVTRIRSPISIGDASATITSVRPEAEEAGVKPGDRIVSVNGRPYTGTADAADEIMRAGDGGLVNIGVERPSDGSQFAATITVRSVVGALSGAERLTLVVVNNLTPILCLALGFFVAALRPRDRVAWLLLGLMIGFSQLPIGIDQLAWSGLMRDVNIAFYKLFEGAWPIWMMLFGIYFPERFSFDIRVPWVKWLLILPLGFFVVVNTILFVGNAEDYRSIQGLHRAVAPFQTVRSVMAFIAIGVLFFCLGWKRGTATNPDAKRRLRLLLLGMEVSLAPMFIISLRSLIRGKPFFDGLPTWVVVPALLLLFLFPLTLAYVIVVQRALDVRVVVRQGVRYAFARGGVLALRFAIIAAIIFVMASQVNREDIQGVEVVVTIVIGLALIFTMRRLGEWLIKWTDRKFFREAYDSEQILADLSEKVRTMVETKPLLETVAERISQSLHVPRVALFLQHNGSYKPAHALGYQDISRVSFEERANTIEHLRHEKEPVRVYLDDATSWVNVTPGFEPEKAKLQELESQLLLPLVVKEKLPGFISLGPKQSEEPYSGSDLRLLQSVATQTGLALENSQLTAAIASEVAQREKLNREVEIAREVQERLFPQSLPHVPGVDYCGACRPALGVGGDYYDFLLLPGDKLGIAIGDVSGKGIAAALLMASLQASLRGQAAHGTDDLANLISTVNRLVYDASSENRYATFFYAQYEPGSRHLTYVNAGHNAPMVLRKENGEWKVLRLDEGGAVIGLLPAFPYSQASLTLERGDLLIGFTDGVSEAMNSAEEEWGEENMLEALKKADGMSAADVISHIMSAADQFAAGARQHDDMTLVVVRIT